MILLMSYFLTFGTSPSLDTSQPLSVIWLNKIKALIPFTSFSCLDHDAAMNEKERETHGTAIAVQEEEIPEIASLFFGE